VHVAYLKKPVLRGVCIRVQPGEIVGLIGANGAGKSTLLRTIAGLLRPSSGDIRMADVSILRKSPRERNRLGIGLLQQGGAVFPSLSVSENLELANSANRNGPFQVAKGVAFEYFPSLQKLADRRAGLLSGGERQMLAIAMILIQKPRMLLLDEPSAGLAVKLARDILERLISYSLKEGASLLLVEQNIEAALRASSRIYRLEGAVAQELNQATLDSLRPSWRVRTFGAGSPSRPEAGKKGTQL
jgi:ABC-type branched-subunit amino acid transport system ATPase component